MLDHYGMAVPHSAEINQELDIINTWEVDIFKIHQVGTEGEGDGERGREVKEREE